MGKLAKSKLNLLRCRELILTLDINLFNRDITPLSSMLLIEPESRANGLYSWIQSCRNPYTDIVFLLALLKISVWTGLSLMTAHLCSFLRNMPRTHSPDTAPSLEIRNLSLPSKEEAIGKQECNNLPPMALHWKVSSLGAGWQWEWLWSLLWSCTWHHLEGPRSLGVLS